MNRKLWLGLCVFLLAAGCLVFLGKTFAQSSTAQSRITQAVDESRLTILRGNTHPFARPEFDRGVAPPDLSMGGMLLVLKASPDQDAATTELLKEQQDPSSPMYHKWLTPDQFGQQFGANDADIQTITSWLQSHGFHIDQVTPGRTLIQFSGTAAQTGAAFHTDIHKYLVNGAEHWANASDPKIPAALTPVVVGVNSLNNFGRRPMSHRVGTFSVNRATHEARPRTPQFNLGTGCGLNNGTCFLVGPGDFSDIYSVPTASTGGTGVTIAIVGDSNINPSDATNFYALFGINRSAPVVTIVPGQSDPGRNGDEGEADIDTQWSGAIAPGATINLVIAPTTGATNGVDTAAVFIVNTMSPTPQILSDSFGACESALGSAGNQMFGGADGNHGLWGQAASEGITVIVATGDQGSAECENPVNQGANTPPQPATTGLAVSGLSSTWNNVAVGGTDFDQFNNTGAFWNNSNTANTQVSVKGYIPETTWNDSCSNSVFTTPGLGFMSTVQANCNDTTVRPSFIVPQGGGGGPSSCAVFAGANCTGYTKPPYQTALTNALDNFRDVPDISLFSGTGLMNSFYPVCQMDQDSNNAQCSFKQEADGSFDIQGFGGTSVATQAFAGIVALIDQKKGAVAPGKGLGRVNDRLYALAGIAANVCTSAAPTPPATNPPAGCIFNDVVKGTIAQPCVLTSPNCSSTSNAIVIPPMRAPSSATILFAAFTCIFFFGQLLLGFRLKNRNWGSVLAILAFALFLTMAACGGGGGGGGGGGNANGIMTNFNAGVGFDEATGIGSVNVTALLNNF